MRKEKKEAICNKASSTNVRLEEIDEEIEELEDEIESLNDKINDFEEEIRRLKIEKDKLIENKQKGFVEARRTHAISPAQVTLEV